jgi:hypothetical protein
MDQARPMTFQQGSPLRVVRLAELLLIRPHQVAAKRADPGQKQDTGDRIMAQRD